MHLLYSVHENVHFFPAFKAFSTVKIILVSRALPLNMNSKRLLATIIHSLLDVNYHAYFQGFRLKRCSLGEIMINHLANHYS